MTNEELKRKLAHRLKGHMIAQNGRTVLDDNWVDEILIPQLMPSVESYADTRIREALADFSFRAKTRINAIEIPVEKDGGYPEGTTYKLGSDFGREIEYTINQLLEELTSSEGKES